MHHAVEAGSAAEVADERAALVVLVPFTISAGLGSGGAQRERSSLVHLTERESDVLGQMAQGRTNAAIAAQLCLSESSIEKYATSIFAKLGLRDEPQTHRRVAAVLAFLEGAGRAQPL